MYDTCAEMPNTPQSCLVCRERCSSRRLGLMLCVGKVLQRGAEGALNQGSEQHAQLQKAAQRRCRRLRSAGLIEALLEKPAFREIRSALMRDFLPLDEGTRQRGRRRTPMQKQGTLASCLIKAHAQGLRGKLDQVASWKAW